MVSSTCCDRDPIRDLLGLSPGPRRPWVPSKTSLSHELHLSLDDGVVSYLRDRQKFFVPDLNFSRDRIEGCFDFSPVYDGIIEWGADGDVFVEVGAYVGQSSSHLAGAIKRSGKNISLFVVDPWPGIRYDIFIKNMISSLVMDSFTPMRTNSIMAASRFDDGSVDFMFADGDHSFEYLSMEIEAWHPKMRRGGVMAGHDYSDSYDGVRRAVDERFGDDVIIHDGCWMVVIR